MLSSALVSRETIVLSQPPLRRPSFRLFPRWKALATETQQPAEWSVVARRSLPGEFFPSRVAHTAFPDSRKGSVHPTQFHLRPTRRNLWIFPANYVSCEAS